MYSFMVGTYRYEPSIYRYILSMYLFSQHAHIENIKTVANLNNNKIQVDVRSSDVMAGAGGGAGPAPDVRHQPEGTACRKCVA